MTVLPRPIPMELADERTMDDSFLYVARDAVSLQGSDICLLLAYEP